MKNLFKTWFPQTLQEELIAAAEIRYRSIIQANLLFIEAKHHAAAQQEKLTYILAERNAVCNPTAPSSTPIEPSTSSDAFPTIVENPQ